MKVFISATALLIATSNFAAAQEKGMTRVLSCKGPDATMEVYLPRSVVKGQGVNIVLVSGSVLGQYSLDLTAAGKGKQIEQVRVSLTPDKSAVIVNQFERKLPPTRIPVSGGTVNFDNRFGTNAKCGPFNTE